VSTDVTVWLDSPLPVPVRLAVVIPTMTLMVWIVTRTVEGSGSWWSRSVLRAMVMPWRWTPPVRQVERWPDGELVDGRVPDDLSDAGAS